jgi:hypothetical protein
MPEGRSDMQDVGLPIHGVSFGLCSSPDTFDLCDFSAAPGLYFP